MNGFRRNVRGRIAAAVLAAVSAAVLTAGCGGSSSTGSGNNSARASAASLKRAAYVSTTAAGYKATMTMHATFNGQGSNQQALDMTASGSFSPSSHSADMTMNMHAPVSGAMHSIEMQVVLDGNTMYLKMPAALTSQLPGGKPWVSMDLTQLGKTAGIQGYGSLLNGESSFSDPGQYLDFLRATSDGSVKDLGQETVDGVQTTHYQANVDFAKLPNAVPAADKHAINQLISEMQSKGVTTQMPVDAWIDDSHHIRRLHINYDFSVSGQSLTMDIMENFSDYGAQPAPAVPSPSDTTDLSSVLQGSLGSTQGA
jgi:hypothetical protein